MNVQLVGAACSIGGKHAGCRRGPEEFRRKQLITLRHQSQHRFHWNETLNERLFGSNQVSVYQYCQRIKNHVRDIIWNNEFPIVIGGDHSCAIGTWNGVAQARRGPVGLLWVDAHMDCHTPMTSHTGRVHGMPISYLLGEGKTRLSNLGHYGPVISAEHTCLVGVRSFEVEEPQILAAKGVSYFTMEQVNQLGLSRVMALANKKVSSCPAGFGISIDLDSLDPSEAPGVSVAEPDGIRFKELIAALRVMPYTDRLRAIEIAELNPELDVNSRTVALIAQLIRSILH